MSTQQEAPKRRVRKSLEAPVVPKSKIPKKHKIIIETDIVYKPSSKQAKWTEEIACYILDEIKEWMIEEDGNIWITEFLMVKYGLASAWLRDMKRKFGDDGTFAKKHEMLKEFQEAKVVNGALKNKFNTAFSIFFLKNHHNWKDQTNIETTTAAQEQPLFPEIKYPKKTITKKI